MQKVIKFDNKEIEIKESIDIPYKDKDQILEQVCDAIKEEYRKYDCEIHDILDSLCVNNLSICDVTRVYAKIYNDIEGDLTIRRCEGEYFDIAKNALYDFDIRGDI